MSAIVDAVKVTLDRTPPELAADIMEQGIVLTGGGALLHGLDSRLTQETGMPIVVARDPLNCVAIGSGQCLEEFEALKQVLITSSAPLTDRRARLPWRRRGAPAAPAPRCCSWSSPSVTIITLDARGGFHRDHLRGRARWPPTPSRPVRSGVDDIIEPIGSFLAGSVHYGAVRQQNQKLQTRDRPAEDAEQPAQADQAERAQAADRPAAPALLGNLQTVPAEVTNFGTSDFAATIDISVGRSDGVQLNMPVVGGGGLVGQVVEANHHTATVRLITDGQSPVGVRYGPGAGSPGRAQRPRARASR